MSEENSFSQAAKFFQGKQNVFIALPESASKDVYAAALGLMLTLEQAGRSATVATATLPSVELSDIFGINRVQNKIPARQPMIEVDNAVGNIERVTWEVKGQKLLLSLHLLNGVRDIDPNTIHIGRSSVNTDLIVVIGAQSLDELGGLVKEDEQFFTAVPSIVIDDRPAHASFGTATIQGEAAVSVSELVARLIQHVQLPFAPDGARNLLYGLRAGTNDFRDQRVSAAQFELAATLARASSQSPQPMLETLPGRGVSPKQDGVPPPGDEDVPPQSPAQTPAQTQLPEPDWLEPKIYQGISIS